VGRRWAFWVLGIECSRTGPAGDVMNFGPEATCMVFR
jgi:hypothetical protein